MRPSEDRGCRARADIVRTAGGKEILLAVISEAQDCAHPGDAAQLTLEHVFHSVTLNESPHVNDGLRDGIASAARALESQRERWGPDTTIGVAAVAVVQGRIFFASAGYALLYLVDEGGCRQLDPRRSAPLGPAGQGSITIGPKEGVTFEPEGRLILASSNLTATSPEDQRPYVQVGDIPGYVSGNPPMEAARHLISIALGRDVAQDLCVVVVEAPGRRRATRNFLGAGLAIVLVLFLIAAGALLLDRLRPTPTGPPDADYGYAVLIDGDLLMQASDPSQPGPIRVQRLETIPAGSRILAQVDSRLSLQTIHEGPSDISTLTIFLSAGSIAELTALDPRQAVAEAGGQQSGAQTIVSVESGAILVRRSDGSRQIQIRSGDTVAEFSPPGASALGVQADPDHRSVECIRGGCVARVADGAPIFIQGPGLVEVTEGTPGPVMAVSADQMAAWDRLCGGCLETSP
jgi:hypothetical protein